MSARNNTRTSITPVCLDKILNVEAQPVQGQLTSHVTAWESRRETARSVCGLSGPCVTWTVVDQWDHNPETEWSQLRLAVVENHVRKFYTKIETVNKRVVVSDVHNHI